ncbi:hypothetical protein D3C86_2019340 [compost metagenome]
MRHPVQHFAEILQHLLLNIAIVYNQQLNRDIFKIGLPADRLNAQRKIFDPVARGNYDRHIMHAADSFRDAPGVRFTII